MHSVRKSAQVMVNGITSSWFVDTGAEIAVVRASLAKAMAIRPIDRDVRVGTTTSDVTGKVGIIDRLRIGTATVENVPVLILPDEQLKIGNVHQIDGILGVQAMIPFGRVAWVDGGSALALGDLAPEARETAPPLYWHSEGVGIPVQTPRGTVGAFLDTGANKTDWRKAGLALLDPAAIAKATQKTMHVGGAGGVVEVKQRQLPPIQVRLAGTPIELANVSVAMTDKVGAAKVGMDAVSQFGTFILDFERMRVDGRLKTAAERKATPKLVLTEKDIQLHQANATTPNSPK